MNGIQYWPFPSTSATFYRPPELQSLPAGPQRNDPEQSAEMFREAQSRQMEQTNAILAGFKDIFKDLAS